METDTEKVPWRPFGASNPFAAPDPRPNRKIETKAIPRKKAYLCPKCDCVHRAIRCPECGAMSVRLVQERD